MTRCAPTSARTERGRHADGLLEKLTCRHCGMNRGKETHWLPPNAATAAGGMET